MAANQSLHTRRQAPGTTSQTQVQTPSDTVPQTESAPPILRLRGAHAPSTHRVQWAENVVDNEGLGRKSSKVCCIYHAPRAVGESSDESSSSSDSDSSSSDSESDSDDNAVYDARERALAQRRAREAQNRHAHDHDHAHGQEKRKSTRRPSPNAYEKQPRPKPPRDGGAGGPSGTSKIGA